jgi:Acetyltransferase (GNAT) family
VNDAVQSVEQLKRVWQMCVQDRGQGDVREEGSLAIRWADNDFSFWNALTNTEVGADGKQLDRMLERASEYMRSRKKTGFLWLFEDLLERDAQESLPAAALRAGLSYGFSGFGMAGDILPLLDAPHHDDLEFVRVRTEEQVEAYGALNCGAYGFAPEVVRSGFSGSKVWTNEIYAYLALKDGVPVAAAATVAADNCLFVILVATASEHQRKGYGEAVTRKALYEGGKATGLRRATLHATMAGMPVYERIGLKKVAKISFYGLSNEAV